MLKPNFLLTNKLPITVYRTEQGKWLEGRYYDGDIKELCIYVNIQPYNMSKIMQLPEATRTKDWYTVFSSEELRDSREGNCGWEADRFEWDGNEYVVQRAKHYNMGILDHYEIEAVRVERT